MPDRAVGVTDEPSGAGVADFRVRERSISGTTMGEQYLIYQGERVVSFTGMAATFYIQSATLGLSLAYLFNQVGSGVLVAVRRALLVMSNTSNTGTVRVPLTALLSTEPTGGTAHTPVAFDTAMTGSSSVVFKGAASADGTTSAITATPGGTVWTQMSQRLASATTTGGQVLPLDSSLIPALAANDPPVLREGEGLLFAYAAGDTASSVAQHIVNVVWDEFTLP